MFTRCGVIKYKCAGYDPNISLKEDDVLALQALYGAGGEANDVGEKPTDAPPPAPSVDKTDNEICSPDFQLDAIFRTVDNRTYVFSGRKFWRLNDVSKI
jgi:Hemopexin